MSVPQSETDSNSPVDCGLAYIRTPIVGAQFLLKGFPRPNILPHQRYS